MQRYMLPTTQFAYRKGLGTCDAVLERGQEARIVQIDFSAAFDRVNHRGFSSCSALWELEVLCCLV